MTVIHLELDLTLEEAELLKDAVGNTYPTASMVRIYEEICNAIRKEMNS
jgi:hypothetical protein